MVAEEFDLPGHPVERIRVALAEWGFKVVLIEPAEDD